MSNIKFPTFNLTSFVIVISLHSSKGLLGFIVGFANMNSIRRRGFHYLHKLNAENIPRDLIEKGQKRVIEASLTLIQERAKLKACVISNLVLITLRKCFSSCLLSLSFAS